MHTNLVAAEIEPNSPVFTEDGRRLGTIVSIRGQSVEYTLDGITTLMPLRAGLTEGSFGLPITRFKGPITIRIEADAPSAAPIAATELNRED